MITKRTLETTFFNKFGYDTDQFALKFYPDGKNYLVLDYNIYDKISNKKAYDLIKRYNLKQEEKIMKYVVKVWSGSGIEKVERYWTCGTMVDALLDVRNELRDEKRKLNKEYGADNWDYSDCKGYTIEATDDDVNDFVGITELKTETIEENDVICVGMSDLYDGSLDKMILKYSDTPKINYFVLVYAKPDGNTSDFSTNNLKDIFNYIYDNDIESQLDITCRLDVDSSENMLNLTTIYTDLNEFTEIGVDPCSENVKYLKYEHLDEVQEAIEKWLTPDNLKLAERY